MSFTIQKTMERYKPEGAKRNPFMSTMRKLHVDKQTSGTEEEIEYS